MYKTLTIVVITLLIILAGASLGNEGKDIVVNNGLCSNLLHSGLEQEAIEIGCNVKEIMKEELEIMKSGKFY